MRTGTQLFILTLVALMGCFLRGVFIDENVDFFIIVFMALGILYVINIVREHYYVMRESKLQKFEVENYWSTVDKHPEVLSERAKKGMGFES